MNPQLLPPSNHPGRPLAHPSLAPSHPLVNQPGFHHWQEHLVPLLNFVSDEPGPSLPSPYWAKQFIRSAYPCACHLCGAHLSGDKGHQARLIRIIPAELGGTNAPDNFWLACPVCASRAKHLDPLDFNLGQAQQAKRSTAGLLAFNHALPGLPSKTFSRAVLAARWQQPRSMAWIFAGPGVGLAVFPLRSARLAWLGVLIEGLAHQGIDLQVVYTAHYLILAWPQADHRRVVHFLVDSNCWLRALTTPGWDNRAARLI